MLSKNMNYWIEIIESMKNENTYKLAWGRAILESLAKDEAFYDESRCVCLKFSTIAKFMLKYYWNQMFFFNLKQSPKRIPVVCQYTQKLIDEYQKISNSNLPVWFNEGINKITEKNSKIYNQIIYQSSNALHRDVSWRFKMVSGKELPVYKLKIFTNKNESQVVFYEDAALELKEYSIILTKLLNFKWSQLLEKFNYAPKISTKITCISNNKINRNNLTKYKEQLLKEFNDGRIIDFYTGKELDKNNISVDHVLPWSFMFSDDIWNLVLTSKEINSSKSNSIPSNDIIERLKQRNKKICCLLDKGFEEEMEYAILNDLVDKYYYDIRI